MKVGKAIGKICLLLLPQLWCEFEENGVARAKTFLTSLHGIPKPLHNYCIIGAGAYFQICSKNGCLYSWAAYKYTVNYDSRIVTLTVEPLYMLLLL